LFLPHIYNFIILSGGILYGGILYNESMKKLLLISCLVFAFAGCGGDGDIKPQALAMPTIDGKIFDFSSAVAQRPVIIAAVAGYCGFCKLMIPLFDELAGEYKGKDVDFVIAFVDDKITVVQGYAQQLNVRHATMAYNAVPFAHYIGLEGFPAVYLINKDGVVEEWVGYSPGFIPQMREKINELL